MLTDPLNQNFKKKEAGVNRTLLLAIICILLLGYGLIFADSRSKIGIIPDHRQQTASHQGNGVSGHYYQGYNIDTSGIISFDNLTEAFSLTDTVINFWDGSQYFRWEPVPGWGDNYSVEWRGYIFIEQPGDYGFGTISDDGSQILIDSILIVDNSELQWYDWEDNISEGDTANTLFPPLTLDSGFHAISVRFYEGGNYDGIELWWLKPGADSSDIPYYGTNFHGIPPTYNANTNWEIIPKSVLYTEKDTVYSYIDFVHDTELPDGIELQQNFPNPFNPSTTIEFSLPESEFVTLKVFNILGEVVAILVNDKLPAGYHTFRFDGSMRASGIYIYRIQAGAHQQLRKMVLIK